MATQPRAQQDDPVPHRWKTRWYRLRFRLNDLISRLLRMPRPLEMNRALKEQRWQGMQIGEEKYLGHCPRHPDELLLDVGRGFFRCIVCYAGTYLGFPDYERHTDPHQHLQITDAMTLAQRHPSLALRKLQHPTGGTPTQEFRAVHWPKTGEKKG